MAKIGNSEDNSEQSFSPDFTKIDQEFQEGEKPGGDRVGILEVDRVNRWMERAANRPNPQKLADIFWHEGEISMLFADTNTGKSVLAVQIADAITSGKNFLNSQIEIDPQPVLYVDCELSDKQFQLRYFDDLDGPYLFSNQLYRAEINLDDLELEGMVETVIIPSIKQAANSTGAKIVVVDNITYLATEPERSKFALPLMKDLKNLKKENDLSILCIAHVPKRDLSKPITRNDLAGSKMLINLTDSAFAIGESVKDPNLRYLKQIKARATAIKYHSGNVLNCELVKQGNFIAFDFLGYGDEHEHLKQPTAKDRETLIEQCKELHERGFSQREIATELGISLGVVNKYLKGKA